MRLFFVCAAFLALLPFGCGGSESHPPTADEMQQTKLFDVGELYRVYSVRFKKPPTKLSDLKPMEMMSPMGLRASRRAR